MRGQAAKLYHLAAHQFRLRGGRRNSFAHQGAAQRSDALEEVERKPTRAMRGQEVDEQAPVQEIDRKGARDDIGATLLFVAREDFGVADILAVRVRRHHNFGDGCRIANAKVEPLRPDRRHHMGEYQG